VGLTINLCRISCEVCIFSNVFTSLETVPLDKNLLYFHSQSLLFKVKWNDMEPMCVFFSVADCGGGSRAIPPETSSYIDVFKWCFMSRHLGNWLMSSHLIFFNTTFYKHFKRMFQEPLPPFCWLLKHQFHCLAVLDCFSRIRLKPTGNTDETGGTGLNQMSS
jgi:hypothetical protein